MCNGVCGDGDGDGDDTKTLLDRLMSVLSSQFNAPLLCLFVRRINGMKITTYKFGNFTQFQHNIWLSKN